MFDNVFYIEDMTSLRYAVPFIKTVKRLLNKDIILIYNDVARQEKYNSIKRYLERFQKICDENDVTSITHRDFLRDNKLKVKNLFCIENISKDIDHENYYSFQHGFDYVTLYKNVKHATYIVNEQYFKQSIERLGIKAVVQPTPVVFWDWEYYINYSCNIGLDIKTAMLFYPEKDSYYSFSLIYNRLKQLNYETLIKQRKKHINIPSEFSTSYYDEIWYPAESIILPIFSDVIVGFQTSAYTDLVHLNRDFIDFAISDESRGFYKPLSNNFRTMPIDFKAAYNEFINYKIPQLTKEQKIKNPCDYKKIKIFLEEVLCL